MEHLGITRDSMSALLGNLALRAIAAIAVFGIAMGAALVQPSTSLAAAPAYSILANTPDYVTAGHLEAVVIAVTNTGRADTSGEVTITDSFPSFVQSPSVVGASTGSEVFPTPAYSCNTSGSSVTCTISEPLHASTEMQFIIVASIEAGASGSGTDTLSVSGGGGPTVAEERDMTIGSPGAIGIKRFDLQAIDAAGAPVAQAGSTPADLTTFLRLPSVGQEPEQVGIDVPTAVELLKDVTVHLPPGMLGDPQLAPRCTLAQLLKRDGASPKANGPSCPQDSQVGQVALPFSIFESDGVGLYNLVPPPGSPAEFGFVYLGVPILITGHLRDSDYGIDVTSVNSASTLPVQGVNVTFWGVPSDPSHDGFRGVCWPSSFDAGPQGTSCPTSVAPAAFLRLPTSCSGQSLPFGVTVDTYEHPEALLDKGTTIPTLTGCERLPFDPSFAIVPSSHTPDSPTGLDATLTLPQNHNPAGLAEADLRKATVTLPEGMTVNPASADGLVACSDADLRLHQYGAATCPDASKIGTVTLRTPLLEKAVGGTIFLRTQNSDDPASGEMIRLAIEMRDDERGVDVKISGKVEIDPLTGQLTTVFEDAPQLPFEEFILHFKSGPRAPLATPQTCGLQMAGAQFTGWNGAARNLSPTFSIECPGIGGFAPGFTAGATNPQAGAPSMFTATFSRADREQEIHTVSVTMPPGLLGTLTNITQCPEPQASTGNCPASSQIGTNTVGTGVGSNPLFLPQAGQPVNPVFLTGPYKGAPFGLSILTHAKAGPIDLGDIVVRARVEVDPHSAQITTTTDPLPRIIRGLPVDLRVDNLTVDRPGFVINPTNCEPLSVTGTITSLQGTDAPVSSHFQAANCAKLPFAPKFTVSTSGKTSRANGATLDAKLSYPPGVSANIAKVKVDLPKQLPSRLTTLQKACPAHVFEANPANCTSASKIGTATATTPILPVQLVGPVYFVSHGGEAFPDLVVVLQGYGVTVDLVGTTFISKAGITSTTFKAIPDVPVGTFELKLPQGRFSALAANGNLCTSHLTMPTSFTAQNGAVIHKSTRIAVTDCAKHKAKETGKANRRMQHGGPGRKRK